MVQVLSPAWTGRVVAAPAGPGCGFKLVASRPIASMIMDSWLPAGVSASVTVARRSDQTGSSDDPTGQ